MAAAEFGAELSHPKRRFLMEFTPKDEGFEMTAIVREDSRFLSKKPSAC